MTHLMPEEFVNALVRARVISANDPVRIERIVIDVQPDRPVAVHVQYAGEENLLDVLPLLARAEQKG
ncbi:MAG: hypothetical protein ACRDP6_42205 [Actinoallomurus sp.]